MTFESSPSQRAFRILVLAQPGPGSAAFVSWLDELGNVSVTALVDFSPRSLLQGRALQPDVVIIDLHALPIPVETLVEILRRTPAPATFFAVTHEQSEVVRRRCRSAGVHGIFQKTCELDDLRAALQRLRGHPLPAAGAERRLISPTSVQL
jgi:DNA-binding NarL/FixJ family response regulator